MLARDLSREGEFLCGLSLASSNVPSEVTLRPKVSPPGFESSLFPRSQSMTYEMGKDKFSELGSSGDGGKDATHLHTHMQDLASLKFSG